MALVLKDRVKQQTTTTGQGTITLSGSYTGFQSFDVIGDSNVTYYTIYDQTTGDWEVGYGTYTASGTTLSRDVVYDSSNAGAKVDFQAGTKTVFCTYPAEQAVYQETNGNLRLTNGVIEVSLDGTSGTTLPQATFQAFATLNDYIQNNIQNLSGGADASSDFVATNDQGDDETFYVDVGVNSSGFNSAAFPIYSPNSGYVFSVGDGAGTASDFFVGSGDGDVILHAGGWDTANIVGTASGTDQSMSFTSDVSVGGTLSATGAADFGSTVLLSADPTLALQAATKQYVDNAASTGIHIHDPCVSETSTALSAAYTQGGTTFDITNITGNKTLTTSVNHGLSVGDEIWLYNTAGNGLSINTAYFVYSTPALNQLTVSLTFGGAELTGLTNASGLTYNTRANSGVGAYLEASANQALPISGVIVGDRVLVYNQSPGYWNGVYTVTALGAADPGGSKWKLTRATDANKYEPSNTSGLGAGDYFFIQSNSEAYVLTDPTGPVIIGYNTITYTLFSSVPAYTVNSPLSLVGTTLSLTTVPANLGGTSFSSYTTGDMLYATGSTTLSKLAAGGQYRVLTMGASTPEWNAVALDQANAVSGSLGATNGGTGQNAYATGDLLYSSATNTLAKLAGNTTTTKKYLVQTGTGSASAAPSWDTVAASDITSGTLAVARGGTGLGSYATGDIVYASGTGTLAGLADAATGNVLLSGGVNTAPSYGKVGLTTHVSGTLPVANGGTGLSSISALSIPVANTLNTYTTVTPSSGQSVRVNAGGTAWEAYTPSSGTVTSVTGTSPVVSSGGSTPAISLASGYGDTQNPYASKTANYVLAAPNGSSGAPTFRAIVAADIPTLNQNTTGSAGSVVNAVTFNNGGSGDASGTSFNGSAARTISYNTVGAPSTTGTNASGTWNIAISGNAATATSAAKWTTARTLSFTGDATGSGSVDGSADVATALTLANTTVTAGSYTYTSLTVDGKGRITAASSGTAPVTSVGATAPIASTGGATPTISISQASSTTNGYLSSTDWNTFNSKGAGTVTSVGGTGSVNGITLSGTVTSTGNLTLGGSLSGVSLTSQVSGTLPVGNGGTGVTSSTGTTAVVLSTTPTITALREVKVAMAANDVNLSTGNYFSKTISGATTLTVSNVPTANTAASFILDLTNGGSATITWWAGMKWAGGAAPTLTAAGRDILGFFTYDGGTTWNGLVLAKDVK